MVGPAEVLSMLWNDFPLHFPTILSPACQKLMPSIQVQTFRPHPKYPNCTPIKFVINLTKKISSQRFWGCLIYLPIHRQHGRISNKSNLVFLVFEQRSLLNFPDRFGDTINCGRTFLRRERMVYFVARFTQKFEEEDIRRLGHFCVHGREVEDA